MGNIVHHGDRNVSKMTLFDGTLWQRGVGDDAMYAGLFLNHEA